MRRFKDEPFRYLTPFDGDKNVPVVQNMWYFKHNDTDFTVTSLSSMVKLMKASPVCFDFFHS